MKHISKFIEQRKIKCIFAVHLLLVGFSAAAYENCVSEKTAMLEKCSYDNYKSEDEYLNYLYKDIASLFPDIGAKINYSQKLWIKARDEICSYTSDDGAEYKIYKNICLYQQTYERNRELKAIIMKEINKNVKEKSMPPSEWREYINYHCAFMEEHFLDKGCQDRNKFLHSKD